MPIPPRPRKNLVAINLTPQDQIHHSGSTNLGA